jgi:hypothetical protein
MKVTQLKERQRWDRYHGINKGSVRLGHYFSVDLENYWVENNTKEWDSQDKHIPESLLGRVNYYWKWDYWDNM